MTTLQNELLKIMKDKDFALITISGLINLILNAIEEAEDDEIYTKFYELKNLLDEKINDLKNREI